MGVRPVAWFVACILAAATVLAAPAQAADQPVAAPPHTIPALRQWTGDTGSYTVTAASRIVVNSGDSPRLTTAAMVLVDDLAELTGWRLRRTTRRPRRPATST